MPSDLFLLMEKAGFSQIEISFFVIRQVSVVEWLRNSGLPNEKIEKIVDMHRTAPPIFKEAYNMKVSSTDCLIDMKMAIVTGRK